MIFLDQPHQQLLAHLRPVLSHDKKEIIIKITDKSQKYGLQTKNIYIIGYPAVIFCTAGLRIDEQEATRMILLSPEMSQDKIKDAIIEKIKRESDKTSYKLLLEQNPDRQLLKQRIRAIKQEEINEIIVKNQDLIKKVFFERVKKFKPKHSRDMGRILSFTKLFALLNLWYRKKEGDVLFANDEDIKEAFSIWDKIATSQELGIPPVIYDLFKDIIVVAFKEKNRDEINFETQGISKAELQQKHYDIYGRFLPDWQLRQQILPMLETAGLIRTDTDLKDKRKLIIYPTLEINQQELKNNSELSGGVDKGGDIK